MIIPNIKLNDLIRIGNSTEAPKALIVRIYTEEEKKDGICGDIEVVYYQNKLKGIKEDAVWNESENCWKFKDSGPSGSYININNYPELKK